MTSGHTHWTMFVVISVTHHRARHKALAALCMSITFPLSFVANTHTPSDPYSGRYVTYIHVVLDMYIRSKEESVHTMTICVAGLKTHFADRIHTCPESAIQPKILCVINIPKTLLLTFETIKGTYTRIYNLLHINLMLVHIFEYGEDVCSFVCSRWQG